MLYFTLNESKCVDDGEEFSDVIGGVFERPDVKQLLPVGDIDPAIFHSSGVAAACGIDSDGVGIGTCRRRVIFLVRLSRHIYAKI